MVMIKVVVGAAFLAAGLAACVFQEPGFYRGGKLIRPEPLAIKEFNSFRFVEKWRISHRWLTGPPEITPCRYLSNGFSDKKDWPALQSEPNSPMFEYRGQLVLVGKHYKTSDFLISAPYEKIYGTNREGKFIGYSSFCGHFFEDTLDGVYINIVEPDPAKGTDEWIKGARPVVINGLTWLRKTEPIKDWTGTRRLAGPVETWVLKIPQTKYWLRLGLSSGTLESSPKFGHLYGPKAFPEKHARIVELFHELVRSVKLEPIEPVDISVLLEAQDNKAGKQ